MTFRYEPGGRAESFDVAAEDYDHADQFCLCSGGPSAGYVNPRCRIGAPIPSVPMR
jgi:hypothetical protein